MAEAAKVTLAYYLSFPLATLAGCVDLVRHSRVRGFTCLEELGLTQALVNKRSGLLEGAAINK
jgi:hypothetical protein